MPDPGVISKYIFTVSKRQAFSPLAEVVVVNLLYKCIPPPFDGITVRDADVVQGRTGIPFPVIQIRPKDPRAIARKIGGPGNWTRGDMWCDPKSEPVMKYCSAGGA